MIKFATPVDGRNILRGNTMLLQIFAVLALSLAIGLGASKWAVEASSGFGAINIGPWRAYPRVGTYHIDPYARAAIIRRTELPLGIGEGLAFSAQADSSGLPFNGRCTYRIAGALPSTRAWTLSVHTPDGRNFQHPIRNYYLTSGMVIFEPQGAIDIKASSSVQAGNWLALPHDAPFTLALRLYDMSVNLAASAIERMPLPEIERLSCQ